MNQHDARQVVIDAISAIAPDADPTSIAGDDDLLEELELDSIDVVGLATHIHESTGIDIPESDYHFLATFDGFVEYVAAAGDGAET